MLYRIDFEHFILHAIDHFTRDELVHLQYLVVSAKVRSNHRATNVVKQSELYPLSEYVIDYASDHDESLLESRMFSEYDRIVKEEPQVFYNFILNPLSRHVDIVLMCAKEENFYMDILCKYIKKEFDIEAIDLNELFTKGKVGPLRIDHDAIWDKTVDIRRAAGREALASLEPSSDGRMKIVTELINRKEKLAK